MVLAYIIVSRCQKAQDITERLQYVLKWNTSTHTSMEIKGKVYCFFEQSGTFKNEFIKLGIPAEDYDIRNNFGQTDHVKDLFAEIESAYSGGGKFVRQNNTGRFSFGFLPLHLLLTTEYHVL